MTPTLESAIVRERRIKLLFFIAAILVLLFSLYKVDNLLISMLLAVVNFYILSPAVDFLERKGFSRQWSTTVPFLVLILFLAILVQFFFPILLEQFKSLQVDLPKYTEISTAFFTNVELKISSVLKDIYPVELGGKIQTQLVNFATTFFQKMPDYISQSLIVLFLAPFLTYFMLLDGRDFVRKLLTLVPNNFFELALNLNHQIGFQMGGFIRARILESVIVSALIWTGLLIMGFPYALSLSLFAGILNIVPYLGPVIGLAPALLIGFANGGGSTELMWILIIYFGAQLVDTVLIVPFVVAKIVDLHPVTVVLAVIVGSQLMGVLGMIISIPLFSILKVSTIAIYKHLTDFRA